MTPTPSTATSTDRRQGPRRKRHLVPEGLTRKRERRGDDRRDSPRPEIALDVREPGKRARSLTGDLSIGGASFITTAPPLNDSVELMFSLPTYVGPIIASGVVVARRGVKKGCQVSVVFTDIDVEAELAIAQWIDREVPLVVGEALSF
ncbi:MAG: PilZ domain-containing protein [Myxococcaceae bacterium]